MNRMNHMLDVFRMENGGVLWLASAATIESAKARVQELPSPGEYLVVDQKTGDKHVITFDLQEGRNTVTEQELVRGGDKP